ncbi:MAG: hypothetical protein ABI348_02180 [Nitrososphaera sp.]|jgi:hypothetical protein
MSSRHQTFFNKVSCRACGYPLTVTKTCSYCYEPVNWQCGKCMYADDSVHGHGGVLAVSKVARVSERMPQKSMRNICAESAPKP